MVPQPRLRRGYTAISFGLERILDAIDQLVQTRRG
jgi:hypothetical protein